KSPCRVPQPRSGCSRFLEREAEELQQRPALLVVGRRGDDRDVHAAQPVDLGLVDLVEHQLLGEAEGVVAPAVELLRREAAEVTDARQREREQPVQELPHPVAAQGHVRADRHALTKLELRDRLAGPGDRRPLTGDRGEVADRALDELRVTGRLTDAHVHLDLGELGHLHDVLVAELLAQLRNDLLAVAQLETRDDPLLSGDGHHLSSPVASVVSPFAAAFFSGFSAFLSSLSFLTLLTWMGASMVRTPPSLAPRGPWWVTLECFLIMLTPSTTTRCSRGKARMTRPLAPLSLPAMTWTRSPFFTCSLGITAPPGRAR